MTRTDVLRDLVANGQNYGPARLYELAAELELLASDLFVIAGQPVPAHLLPPARDPEVVREFTYRVTYCNHEQLAALKEFILSLASESPAPTPEMRPAPPCTDRFAEILAGFMRNRGLGIGEMPFTGLSQSTIRGMLNGRWHNMQQLKAMAGPLGWRFRDLAAVAGEPLVSFGDCSTLCHHFGAVYVAAIPLTTDQVIQALPEAGRVHHGVWRPVVNSGHTDCPDPDGRHWGVWEAGS